MYCDKKCILTIYVMKQYIDILIMLIVAFLMLTKPRGAVDIAKTQIGVLVIILAVIAVSKYVSTLSGLLVAALFVYLMESVFEGMTNKADTPDEKAEKLDNDYQNILEMRKEHCKEKNGQTLFTNSNGEVMTLDEVKKMYPQYTFDDKSCTNPCDDGCDINITESMEQLTVEESLRPKQSSQHATQREKDFVQEGFKNIM